MIAWKYHLVHRWERQRQVWEDVYLLPDTAEYDGPGLHLTVDALGDVNDPLHGSDRADMQREAMQKLGDAAFWIEGTDMIVRQVDFDREELLAWVRLWLTQSGLPVGALQEGPFDDFANRLSCDASAIAEVCEALRSRV